MRQISGSRSKFDISMISRSDYQNVEPSTKRSKKRRVSQTLPTRRFLLIPFHALRNLHDGLFAPNMHRTFHVQSFETARFDAQHISSGGRVDEPAAACGAEIAFERAAGERLAGVDANGTLVGGYDGKGWEAGGDAEGGG